MYICEDKNSENKNTNAFDIYPPNREPPNSIHTTPNSGCLQPTALVWELQLKPIQPMGGQTTPFNVPYMELIQPMMTQLTTARPTGAPTTTTYIA
jgi:hypothetical protein